jgi:hypothetical protein
MYMSRTASTIPENGNKEVYTYPGDGQGRKLDVMTDLMKSGYDGGISIEPHLAAVFHDADSNTGSKEDPIEIYLKYGGNSWTSLILLDIPTNPINLYPVKTNRRTEKSIRRFLLQHGLVPNIIGSG